MPASGGTCVPHFHPSDYVYSSVRCKCSVLGLPIDVKIKDRNGKIVQKFHVIGPQQIDQILLWIWRDVLVSIFVAGTQKDKDKVPDFLIDIESVFGVTALERLLQGGKTGATC